MTVYEYIQEQLPQYRGISKETLVALENMWVVSADPIHKSCTAAEMLRKRAVAKVKVSAYEYLSGVTRTWTSGSMDYEFSAV